MYHRITTDVKSVYDRSPADFKADLTVLASQNYVPVTAAELAAGRVDIPAGKHPVVLTFDDASTSQFRLGSDDQPVAGTAVAILLDFAEGHPGFRPTATFYANAAPFGSSNGERVLAWLHEHDFEVGDHTTTHTSLKQLSAAGVQKEIGGNLAMIQRAAPGIRVTTIALPFGVHPKSEVLAHRGSYRGTAYSFAGVFLVGANPAPSPYSASFDPFNIPRIRANSRPNPESQYESKYWLAWLQSHPTRRYTSDGDPAHISYPRAAGGTVAARYRAAAAPY
jgi:peptidoglycan/xylan/chitin deacetylase (PgdA/CDA1 family)